MKHLWRVGIPLFLCFFGCRSTVWPDSSRTDIDTEVMDARAWAEEAEAAIDRKDFVGAHAAYDRAYQLSGDSRMLMESALAASMSGDWEMAVYRFSGVIRSVDLQISADLRYRMQAEMDRIIAMTSGHTVVTQRTLAEEIYAERKGEEMADGPPPSMQMNAEGGLRSPFAAEQADKGLHSRIRCGNALLDDLLFYGGSRSATVRFRAVSDLSACVDPRTIRFFEDRVLNDRNIHIRALAVEILTQRRSVASLTVLEQALASTSLSSERASLRRAITTLRQTP